MANPPVPFPSGGHIQKNTQAGYFRNLWIPSSFDYDVMEDAFFGDALLDQYPAAKTNGTSAARTFTEHNANGYLELVSGTDDDGYAGTGFGLNWTGDRGVLFEGVVKLPSDISTVKFEIGVSDADDDAGAVNAKATPTVTATDCAVFVFDTDDDTDFDFVTAKAGSAAFTRGVYTPSASDTIRFAIRVETDTVMAWVNDNFVAGGSHTIEGGNGLTPWFFCQARAVSSSRTLQVHKWRMTQPAF